MKNWKELTHIEKIFIGLFVVTIIILIPEASFLLDAGGIELITFLLVMYSQNIKIWYDSHFSFLKYPIIEMGVYVKSISLTSVLFLITSSFIFSSGFFLLLMFLKKEF